MLFKKREIATTKVELVNEVNELTEGQLAQVSGGTGENESKGKKGDIVTPEIE